MRIWLILFSFVIVLPTFLYAEESATSTTDVPAGSQASENLGNEDLIKFKIDLRNNQIKSLEAEIEQHRKDLEVVSKEKNTLQNTLNTLTITGKKLSAELKLTQTKLTKTDATLKDLRSSITDKSLRLGTVNKALERSIKEIHFIDNFSVPEIILSQNTLSDSWREIEFLKRMQLKLNVRAEELKNLREDLEESKKLYESARRGLSILNSELKDRKFLVDQNAKQKNLLLKVTKNKESEYQKQLETKLIIKDSLEAEIREYESQLVFVLDPSTLPPEGTRPFSWPLDSVRVTQLFGRTVGASRLYASGSHNGVDFRAPPGTRVKTVFPGVVAGTGDTDITCPGASFGRWVLIRHANGLATTYGHLSLIRVVKGQTVSAGEVIGYSGNTGYSTGPHLHISVYASAAVTITQRPSKVCGGRIFTLPVAAINAYLDPMKYFPRYSN